MAIREFLSLPISEEIVASALKKGDFPPLDVSKVSFTPIDRSNVHGLTIAFNTNREGIAAGYKGRTAFAVGLEEKSPRLVVAQIQGARSGEASKAAFRLAQGLRWTDLITNLLIEAIQNPQSPFTTLSVPKMAHIEGMEAALERSSRAFGLYAQVIAAASLRFNPESGFFERTFDKSSS